MANQINLSRTVLDKLRDLRESGKETHPSLSYSTTLELLIAHWDEVTPDWRWVQDFKFETRRGRQRLN